MGTAGTVIEQLGGNKFVAMTGAKNFMGLSSGLQFDLPKSAHYVKNGINRVHVVLTTMDEYTVTFYKISKRGLECKTIAEVKHVYSDQLCTVFTAGTGLETRL
ncbi:hypothetical protein [Desulfovibrio cuneatus]|uniref:hypothetical protein n=1 Tax=Desulfovibrio cuneatus TaxID=159728 RepID=UPI0004026EDD|nr:hypothetical protein [Desulfovibrio cuneatus]